MILWLTSWLGRWQGDRSLSNGYSDEGYRDTNYKFTVTVFSDRKTDNLGKTIVTASAKIRINTGKGLSVHIDSLTAELIAQKPENGVLWNDSEWFKKTKPWTIALPDRSDDALITIWRSKLENYVDRKIMETADAPTIELVARPVR